MNIAVLGYYGYGNAGDEVILQNITRLLAPHQVYPLPLGLNYSSDTFRRLNRYDFLILGGGGLINDEPPSPFANFRLWDKDLQRPIGLLGIGVGGLSDQFRRSIDRLLDQAVFCLVRDQESRRILRHPKVQVAPDLTFYNPFPFREQSRPFPGAEPARCGVNLRPKHPAVTAWVETLQGLPFDLVPIPFSSHPALGDREILATLVPGNFKDFNPRSYDGIDFLVATAFHAVVFAIQMGIPVIAINYDPKVSRLMEESGLSEYLLDWEEYTKLPEKIVGLIDRRDEVRGRMNAYTKAAHNQLRQALEAPRRQIDSFQETTRSVYWTEIPGQPLISVLVDARQAVAEDVQATLKSVLTQQYQDVEVFLLVQPGGQKWVHHLTGDSRLRTLEVAGTKLRDLETGITAARGEYLTWLAPGGRLEPDALPLAVHKLHGRPDAPVAIWGYFLSENGVIQRKVRLHNPMDRVTPLFYGPGFLVRRTHARGFLLRQVERPDERPDPARTVYLEITLSHQPESNRERNLFRGLLAFSRGETSTGRGYLANAFQPADEDRYQEADLIELIARIARNATVTETPLEFVRMIENQLPPAAAPLRPLLKKVRGHITMTRFFETHAIRPWHELVRTAWRGIQLDPTWLRNKGVWSILGRSMVSGFRSQKVKAAGQG